MSHIVTDYGPQLERQAPQIFDRPNLRSSLLTSNFASPSRRHDLQHTPIDPPFASPNSLIAPYQCYDSNMASPAVQSKGKTPNWKEFYKNGLPREIIVIEDTPEPPPPPSATTGGNSNPSNYHLITTNESLMQVPIPRKRKIDETQEEFEARKSQAILDAKYGVFPNASKAATRYELPPLGTHPKPAAQVASANTVQKRRRTRLQSAEEPIVEKCQFGYPDIEYRGLTKPVVRSKDVAVRIGHTSSHLSRSKIDDDDGHFIVLPETDLTNQYKIRKQLGQGTFGKVVQAVDHKRNELVAVKIIRSVQKYRDAAKIELRVLQTLRQNDAENKYKCIHLRDCFDFFGHTCIVMDLLDSSLFDFLKSNQFVPFPNSHIQSFAKQLLTSVAFLHDLGLIHTDLKPENILLRDANYQTFTYNRAVPSSRVGATRQATQRRVLLSTDIRLIDFGSATFQDEYHSSVVSTRHYRAPEIILGLGWSFPCDIWSIGCILVEFFTGDALFQTHDNLEHLAMMEAVLQLRIDASLVRQVNKMASRGNNAASYFKRLKLCYPTPDTSRGSRRFVRSMKKLTDIIPCHTPFMQQFLDLLQRMFVYDPSRRITAKEALKHPWFQEPVRDDGTEAAKIALARAQAAQQNGHA
ncbi:kinase-like domain-containing protein [Stachybotrys elegans]|uniref:Kinase-like domain-containing protein n=1 Tax=Stachybotrys elegans TaxID=80388 RepID=A0A8K0T5F1_9HYPO|nr:kinase-like domain-containing protein [Stachybotrys elegans]